MKDLLHAIVETRFGLGQIIEVFEGRFKVHLDIGEYVSLERADFEVLTRLPNPERVIEGLSEVLDTCPNLPGKEYVKDAKLLVSRSLMDQIDEMGKGQERMEAAKAWAGGRWVELDRNISPKKYGRYQLHYTEKWWYALYLHIPWTVDWFEPYASNPIGSTKCVDCPFTGTHESWADFCDKANRMDIKLIWSEPTPWINDRCEPV